MRFIKKVILFVFACIIFFATMYLIDYFFGEVNGYKTYIIEAITFSILVALELWVASGIFMVASIYGYIVYNYTYQQQFPYYTFSGAIKFTTIALIGLIIALFCQLLINKKRRK